MYSPKIHKRPKARTETVNPTVWQQIAHVKMCRAAARGRKQLSKDKP